MLDERVIRDVVGRLSRKHKDVFFLFMKLLACSGNREDVVRTGGRGGIGRFFNRIDVIVV
jgi:hypothetical protein